MSAYYITQKNIRKIYQCLEVFPKCIPLLRRFNKLKAGEYLTFRDITDTYHLRPTVSQWNVFRKAFGKDRWGNGVGFIEGRRGISYDKLKELDWYVADKQGLTDFLMRYDNGEYND